MINLSSIKNARLETLLGSSRKFKLLSESEQIQQIQALATKSEADQEKACKFLEKENGKNTKKMEMLKSLYDQVVKLEENFKKLLMEDPEKKSQEGDSEKMDGLLTQLKSS